MGTRHLVCVIKDKKPVIAQYGHYDGYPECRGVEVLEFLRTKFDADGFIENIPLIQYVSEEVRESRNRQPHSLSLHASGDIIGIVQEATKVVEVVNSYSFAQDSMFCEWCYVVDLDTNMFEIYKGWNQTPLGESDRFFDPKAPLAKADDDYYAVKLLWSYSLEALPDRVKFLQDYAQA